MFQQTTKNLVPGAIASISHDVVGKSFVAGDKHFMEYPWKNLQEKDLPNELWIPIDGYNGYYDISNLGRIRTWKSIGYRSIPKLDKPKIKTQVLNTSGYPAVNLSRKFQASHRLFAKAFIPNPENKPCVNHLDGDKENLSIDNLQWVTYSENNKHAYETGLKLRVNTLRSYAHQQSKTVEQYSLDGKFIREFGSGGEVARYFGVKATKISMVVMGKRKTWKGFIWKYKEERKC